jgi:hypothetical protein
VWDERDGVHPFPDVLSREMDRDGSAASSSASALTGRGVAVLS